MTARDGVGWLRLPGWFRLRLDRWALAKRISRAPDFIIGEQYLMRWWVIPRNRWFNIYLHKICRSDDDRALHDHPWWNVSIVLWGGYFEHVIDAGGVHRRIWRAPGSITVRRAKAAHRLELRSVRGMPGGVQSAITLFITGPRIRAWGFHCPEAGWRHWEDFTAPGDSSKVGRGCE